MRSPGSGDTAGTACRPEAAGPGRSGGAVGGGGALELAVEVPHAVAGADAPDLRDVARDALDRVHLPAGRRRRRLVLH